MKQSTHATKSILLLSLAGLGSSLITIATADFVLSVGRWVGGSLGLTLVRQFYEGIVFGGSIATYFVLRERVRSVERLVAFICACVAAHLASMFVAFWINSMFARDLTMGSHHLDIPLPVFFGGGFVGAFIVLAAALFLFGAGDTARRSIGKIFLCAAVGGVLGVIGWASGPFLGVDLWLGLRALHLVPPSQSYQLIDPGTGNFLSLPVVWQTGIALLLAMMLSSEDAISDAPASPGTLRLERRKIPKFATILFFGGIFALLGWQVSRIVRGQIAMKHRQENSRRAIAELPSSENLPSMEPMPVEKALLVEQIGALFVTNPRVYRPPFQPNGTHSVPETIEYSVGYAPVDRMILLAEIANVSVRQFPNAEWALYRTKYPSFSPMDDPRSRSTVTKFGNRIVMDTAWRYPNGGGRLYFFWPNGNVVVTIRYETRDVNEEILKRYLDKYPSSL